jgi:uncharacterized protein (DUF433 family)
MNARKLKQGKNKRGSSKSSVVITAFSEDHVERLTGISVGQLRYWDRTGFFKPTFAEDDRRQAYSRIYSFRDVVCLHVLNALRNNAKVSLPHLREVKNKLAHLGEDMWAKTTLYVLNKKVIFDNPETKKREEIVTGQAILEIPLEVVRGRMEEAVRNLWARKEDNIGRIERARNTIRNLPVIAGTRIPIRAVQNFRDAGYSIKQIIAEYPDLTPKDVEAALAHKSSKIAA